MDLRIRDAARGDTRFLAWVMQEAARSHLEKGVWDVGIPEDDRRADFLDAVSTAEPPCFMHFQGFLVAEIDGRQVAALSGYEPAVALPAIAPAQEAAMRALGWSESEMRDLGDRMRSLGNPFPESPEDRWVIEWVATVPELRGRGIIHELLTGILERGRERGYRRAQVGYLLGNVRAKRAYERVGFATIDEKRDPDFEAVLGCPGIARMHRDL
jgi:translation initiation factor 4G